MSLLPSILISSDQMIINTDGIAFFFTESIYRHYFELEGDYISLDIMDTAGKVNH